MQGAERIKLTTKNTIFSLTRNVKESSLSGKKAITRRKL